MSHLLTRSHTIIAVAMILALTFTISACADNKWRELAQGMDIQSLTYQGSPVTAVRVELNKCKLRVVNAYRNAEHAGVMAEAACPKVGAAINASFFDTARAPMGLLIVDGKQVRRPLRAAGWSTFYVAGHRAGIVPAGTKLTGGVTQALQCKPRLVVDGKVQSFKANAATRRSAVGIDAQGRVLLVAADGDLTLEQWAACLRDEFGCIDALNLDGGPSTQLAVNGKTRYPGGWPVPVLLVAEKKGTVSPRRR